MSLTDVRWIGLQQVRDERGTLTSLESGLQVPFEIRRVFFLHGVQGVRGGHADRSTSQLLVPAAGQFHIELTDGVTSNAYAMNDPQRALYVLR